MNQMAITARPGHDFRPIRAASVMLGGVRKELAAWTARRRGRRALLSLSEYELKDIGVSRAQAQFELSKPFWHE